MELEELKQMWNAEHAALESRVKVNEKRIQEMNMDRSSKEFDKLLGISILGRNLALVYMALSFFLGFKVLGELAYSVPVFIGGLAMLWSFTQHFSLKKLDISSLTLIELQKAIANFKLHTSKYAKYDMSIVIFWILTLAPVYLKIHFKIDIYASLQHMIYAVLIVSVLVVLVMLGSKKIYQNWDLKLQNAQESLNELQEFEQL